jgi:hypothetical protein
VIICALQFWRDIWFGFHSQASCSVLPLRRLLTLRDPHWKLLSWFSSLPA